MNPLFNQKIIKAGEASLAVVLTELDTYEVQVTFPMDAFRVYASKWNNPLRVALEAADEALNALRCEIFNQELNEGKPYEKPAPPEPDAIVYLADEEKKDG